MDVMILCGLLILMLLTPGPPQPVSGVIPLLDRLMRQVANC